MLKLTRPEGTEPGDLNLSRSMLGGLFFAGYAAAAVSASADPIVTDLTGLVAESAVIPAGDFNVPAYLARPDARGKFPVIVVVSEVFGVHEYIRDVCRRLAKLGFVAIAPDFFARHGDPAPLTDFAAIRAIVAAATDQQVMGDLEATVAWLKKQAFVQRDRMGITGFCWGGASVWLACQRFKHFRAGVAWYGRLSRPAAGQFLSEPDRAWPLELVADLKVPVLGLYAGKDQGIPLADVDLMNLRLLEYRKTGSLIVTYPEAQHGFHADYRASYDLDAAQDGWRRMIDFFEERGIRGKRF
jgi:carboxymethylenebutenolidase